jgi:hypothetical protein
MTPGLETEAASLFEDARTNDLAQFEPDPEGHEGLPVAAETTVPEVADTPWIVWPDALEESVWAAMELRLYGNSPA